MRRTARIVVLYTPEAKAEIEAYARLCGFYSTSEYIRALLAQHMGAGDDRRLWPPKEKP